MTTKSLVGQRVLITGAARGIGAGLARECARRGARVALVGLEPERLAALAIELGPEHVWAEADVTSSEALDGAVAQVVSAFGGLDHVVANAGIANYGTVRITDPESFARVVDVNLTGMFRTLHATVPHLIESKGYALIVCSVASFVQMPGMAAYGASKAGAESLAGAAREELAHLGVMVGSAHPSWIDTDLVRGAEQDLPSFKLARDKMPWPTRSVTSVEACVQAMADGLERRARRIYVPKAALLVHLSRVLLASGPASKLASRVSAQVVPQMEAEVTALGRHLAAHTESLARR